MRDVRPCFCFVQLCVMSILGRKWELEESLSCRVLSGRGDCLG